MCPQFLIICVSPIFDFVYPKESMPTEKRIPVDDLTLDPSRCSITFYRDDEVGVFAYISLGLNPFDSGLGYPDPPETTHIDLECVELGDVSLDSLEGKEFNFSNEGKEDIDGSIYLNAAHNPVDVLKVIFLKVTDESVRVDIEVFCNFEFEMVAKNETLRFTADLQITVDDRE